MCCILCNIGLNRIGGKIRDIFFVVLLTATLTTGEWFVLNLASRRGASLLKSIQQDVRMFRIGVGGRGRSPFTLTNLAARNLRRYTQVEPIFYPPTRCDRIFQGGGVSTSRGSTFRL